MDEQIVVTFRFVGGDADENQLDFYEASRFQYGAARLIYTLEYFRQTGNVLSKIYRDSLKADYRITSAKEGSFIQEILLVSAPVLADNFIKAPIQAALGYVFEQFFSFKSTKDKTVQVLDAYKAIEQEKTLQSIEETKRATLQAETTKDLIQIIQNQIETSRGSTILNRELVSLVHSLQASGDRQAQLEEYKDEFDRISYDANIALIQKTRPQIAEIGRPLRRSAERLEVSDARREAQLAAINYSDVLGLRGDVLDPELIELVGSIKSYDKETGWGKWRQPGNAKPIPFQVKPSERSRIGDDVIESMKEEEVHAVFQRVVDTMKETKHLILVEVTEIFG